MEQKHNDLTLGETLITMRNMVDTFVSMNDLAWEKYREKYKAEHGFEIGRSLSLQSYIGTDLLIDLAYLAYEVEKGEPFTREYWIRSMGTQCIKDEEDKELVRNAFGDILGKFSLTFDGKLFQDIHWFEDEDCLIENAILHHGDFNLYYKFF